MPALPLTARRSQRSNTAIEHPAKAAGCTRKQIAVFERIAVGSDEWHPPKILAALVAKGLVMLRDQTVADRPFLVTVLRPFVPGPIHEQWRQWCVENGPTEGGKEEPCPTPLTDAQHRLLLRLFCTGELHGPDPSLHRGDFKTVSGAEGRDLIERGLIAINSLQDSYGTERLDDAPYLTVTHRYFITAAGRAAHRSWAAIFDPLSNGPAWQDGCAT